MPGLEAQPIIRLDVWTRPLLAGSTGAALGNIFLTIEDSIGTRAAAFRFGTAFGQTIDYGTNVAGVWQPTSILWDTDTWYRLTLDVDYFAKTYNMAVNGVLVNSSPIPFYTATSTSFSQVRIFRGANSGGDDHGRSFCLCRSRTCMCRLGARRCVRRLPAAAPIPVTPAIEPRSVVTARRFR
jgi:hypothetical protein